MSILKRTSALITAVAMLTVALLLPGCSSAPAASAAPAPSAPAASASEAAPAAPVAPAAPAAPAKVDYPTKNVSIILPYGSGSSTEAMLRVACQLVEKKLDSKYKFIIVNKEGGSGEIGLTQAFKAPKDGYTLAMFHTPHIALKLVRGDACPFSYEDFRPITNFTTDPGAWLINSKDKEKYPDFNALIAAAKAAPGKVSVACGGLNTSEGRLIKQLQRELGVEFKIVPIDGDAEFVATLRGGHVDALVTQVGDVMSIIEEGVFIPLVVGTKQRIAELPDTPTFYDLGYKIESFSMRSLAAPAGIPEDIYKLLCDSFSEALQSEELLAKSKELNMSISYKTADEIGAIWKAIDEGNRAEWAIAPWN